MQKLQENPTEICADTRLLVRLCSVTAAVAVPGGKLGRNNHPPVQE